MSNPENLPLSILLGANNALNQTLPEASLKKYIKEYEDFETWKLSEKTNSNCELVFLAYFNHLSTKYSSSSLYAKYSMLKAMMRHHHNVNIKGYEKLKAFLKNKNVNHVAKKAKILEMEEVEQFISEAPNDEFLEIKVILTILYFYIFLSK